MQKITCFPQLSGIFARKAGSCFCMYAVDRMGSPVDRVHCAVDTPVDRAHCRLTKMSSVRNPESSCFQVFQALFARSTAWGSRSTGPSLLRQKQEITGTYLLQVLQARSTGHCARSTGHSAVAVVWFHSVLHGLLQSFLDMTFSILVHVFLT